MRALSCRLLLISTLLLAQWVAIAHFGDHPTLAPDAGCTVCLHAASLGGPVAAVVGPAPAAAGYEPVPPLQPSAAARTPRITPPSRGPPIFPS